MEKGKAPEDLQHIDDVVWGNMAEEVFEKGEKIIQIILKAAIKQSQVKGTAQDIQLSGGTWQDGCC